MILNLVIIWTIWIVVIDYINRTRFSCMYFIIFPLVLSGFVFFKNALNLYPQIQTIQVIIFIHIPLVIFFLYMLISDLLARKRVSQKTKMSILANNKKRVTNSVSDKKDKKSNEKPHLISKYFDFEEQYYQFEDIPTKIYALYKLSLFKYEDLEWKPVEWNSDEMNGFYDTLHFNMTCGTEFLRRAGMQPLKQLSDKDLKRDKIPTIPSKYLKVNFP